MDKNDTLTDEDEDVITKQAQHLQKFIIDFEN
jgi:hypothetical protein